MRLSLEAIASGVVFHPHLLSMYQLVRFILQREELQRCDAGSRVGEGSILFDDAAAVNI
jgi:hypothetical protein